MKNVLAVIVRKYSAAKIAKIWDSGTSEARSGAYSLIAYALEREQAMDRSRKLSESLQVVDRDSKILILWFGRAKNMKKR